MYIWCISCISVRLVHKIYKIYTDLYILYIVYPTTRDATFWILQGRQTLHFWPFQTAREYRPRSSGSKRCLSRCRILCSQLKTTLATPGSYRAGDDRERLLPEVQRTGGLAPVSALPGVRKFDIGGSIEESARSSRPAATKRRGRLCAASALNRAGLH